MRPNILAKATFTDEQASNKMSIGCDGIEIQLFGELIVNKKMGIYRRYSEAFNVDSFVRKYPIDIIHSPLVKGDMLLEDLVDSKDEILLSEIFDLAQHIAERRGKNIGVVIHSESYYSKLEDEDKWKDVVLHTGTLLAFHPNVNLIIENVSPYRDIVHRGLPRLSNNYGFDNVEMVKKLREDCGISRIYTCLDTAHAMISIRCIDALYNFMNDLPRAELCMRDYFKENKDCIGLIHLANIKDSGYGKGKHGILFREDQYDELCEIMKLYTEYGYSCPITLEVEEEDYTNSVNYKVTKALVEEYFDSIK